LSFLLAVRGLPDAPPCQQTNAGLLELNDKSYNGVCPPGIDSEFCRCHQTGDDIFLARDELCDLDPDIRWARGSLRDYV